jgi:hypothetical protein
VKWKKSSKIDIGFLSEAEDRDAVEQDLRLLHTACRFDDVVDYIWPYAGTR